MTHVPTLLVSVPCEQPMIYNLKHLIHRPRGRLGQPPGPSNTPESCDQRTFMGDEIGAGPCSGRAARKGCLVTSDLHPPQEQQGGMLYRHRQNSSIVTAGAETVNVFLWKLGNPKML